MPGHRGIVTWPVTGRTDRATRSRSAVPMLASPWTGTAVRGSGVQQTPCESRPRPYVPRLPLTSTSSVELSPHADRGPSTGNVSIVSPSGASRAVRSPPGAPDLPARPAPVRSVERTVLLPEPGRQPRRAVQDRHAGRAQDLSPATHADARSRARHRVAGHRQHREHRHECDGHANLLAVACSRSATPPAASPGPTLPCHQAPRAPLDRRDSLVVICASSALGGEAGHAAADHAGGSARHLIATDVRAPAHSKISLLPCQRCRNLSGVPTARRVPGLLAAGLLVREIRVAVARARVDGQSARAQLLIRYSSRLTSIESGIMLGLLRHPSSQELAMFHRDRSHLHIVRTP